MGGCCASNKHVDNTNENFNEVEVEPSSNNITNYDIYQNKIEKIQSYFRGMKIRKRLRKLQTNSSYLISNETYPHIPEVTQQEYEEFLQLYPKLDIENNNNKIKTVKNVILDNKELYYGEYNTEKKMKEGRGILVNQEGTKYYGYFINNKKNIKGKLKHYEGDIYEGEWLDDRANGKGKYIHIDGTTYEGDWKNDKQEGYGIETWNDGSYYKDNTINGKGKYIWDNKKTYEGDWVNNKMRGNGIFIWPDGRKYKGEYVDDKKEGYGIYYWPDGRVYEGMWKNGYQNGEGVLFDPNLNKKRKGIWKNGKKIKWLE